METRLPCPVLLSFFTTLYAVTPSRLRKVEFIGKRWNIFCSDWMPFAVIFVSSSLQTSHSREPMQRLCAAGFTNGVLWENHTCPLWPWDGCRPNIMIEWLAPVLRMRMFPASNPGAVASYHNLGSLWFSLSIASSNIPSSYRFPVFYSTSYPIHHSLSSYPIHHSLPSYRSTIHNVYIRKGAIETKIK
jgi:hypothetical protein